MKTDDSMLYLGFDIGASSVKWGYGNLEQGLLCHHSFAISTKSLSFLSSLFARAIDITKEQIGLKRIAGIGIGTPGTIEKSSGKIRGINPNLPFWSDISPQVLIPKTLDIPVFYDNDANLMCLGESTLWEAVEDIVGITVGSGIGCGYVSRGDVFHGAHGYAMELGHVNVVPEGEMCGCGRKGCLEAYSAVDAIKRRAKLYAGYSSALEWDLNALLCHAREDSRLQNMIDEGEYWLAQALANLSVVLDPQLILLGGGGMDGGMYNAQRINMMVQNMLPLANRNHTIIKQAKAGNRAGVLGAIKLAESKLILPSE